MAMLPGPFCSERGQTSPSFTAMSELGVSKVPARAEISTSQNPSHAVFQENEPTADQVREQDSMTFESEHLPPPLNYIVFKGTPESAASSSHARSRIPGTGFIRNPPPSFSSVASSSTFKLQPRRPVKCTPSPATRGRKRRANSLCSPVDVSPSYDYALVHHGKLRSDSLGDDTLSTVSTQKVFLDHDPGDRSSPAERVSHAAVTFEGLSLATPNNHFPASQCMDGRSPASFIGSHASLARSSFSKYNALASPAGSMSTMLRMSPAGSYTGSTRSPRLAPVTVLAHNNGAKLPPRPDFNIKLPFASLKDPPTIAGTPATVNRDTSHSSGSWSSSSHHRDGFDGPSPPSFKQARTEPLLESSPSRSVQSALSPEGTPLPRLNLTPRNARGRSIRGDDGNALAPPMLPSTLDLDSVPPRITRDPLPASLPSMIRTSATRADPEETMFSPTGPPALARTRVESFIPLPDFGGDGRMSSTLDEEDVASHTFHSAKVPTSCLAAQLPQPRAATASGEDLMRFMQDSADKHPPCDDNSNHGDADSLDASDDEDAFFLVAPSVINEEKQSSLQSVKQRKLRASSSMHELSRAGPSATSLDGASNTSLFGMDFINNSTASNTGYLNHQSSQESSGSIGLPLEGNSNISAGASSARLLDQNCTSPTRDLITPPVMSQPRSPPPLSPRSDRYEYHDSPIFSKDSNSNHCQLFSN